MTLSSRDQYGHQTNKTLLLLTSTIVPFPGMERKSIRSDPEIREEDYRRALTRYLALPEGPPESVLFVDNSGRDLSSLEASAKRANPLNRDLRFLSVDPVGVERLSKPYGEMDILDQAVKTLLGEGAAPIVIWKVTGRLFVSNLPALLRSRPASARLYCDLRSVPLIGDTFGGNPWFDMRLWAFSPEFYVDHFFGLKDRLASIAEGSLYKTTRELIEEGHDIAPRFRVQPRFEGYSGATNRNYNDPAANLKNVVRSAARRFFPSLWL